MLCHDIYSERMGFKLKFSFDSHQLNSSFCYSFLFRTITSILLHHAMLPFTKFGLFFKRKQRTGFSSQNNNDQISMQSSSIFTKTWSDSTRYQTSKLCFQKCRFSWIRDVARSQFLPWQMAFLSIFGQKPSQF